MIKTENQKGYLISYGIVVLLTVAVFGVFFIGTDGIAQINNMVCAEYECTGTETQYGYVTDIYDTCVLLCPGDPYLLLGGWFAGYLYPLDGKNLLGLADSMYGMAGCSAEFRSRSMTVDLSYIEEDDGYNDKLTCTPCTGCCE